MTCKALWPVFPFCICLGWGRFRHWFFWVCFLSFHPESYHWDPEIPTVSKIISERFFSPRRFIKNVRENLTCLQKTCRYLKPRVDFQINFQLSKAFAGHHQQPNHKSEVGRCLWLLIWLSSPLFSLVATIADNAGFLHVKYKTRSGVRGGGDYTWIITEQITEILAKSHNYQNMEWAAWRSKELCTYTIYSKGRWNWTYSTTNMLSFLSGLRRHSLGSSRNHAKLIDRFHCHAIKK